MQLVNNQRVPVPVPVPVLKHSLLSVMSVIEVFPTVLPPSYLLCTQVKGYPLHFGPATPATEAVRLLIICPKRT